MLHVTNGESVVETMREMRLPGDYLSWIDVLHDGPVPLQAPADLARTRADFIASSGWDQYESVLRSFTERDATLNAHADDDEIVLWFEHDLFDQLQLIQILDRLSTTEIRAKLSIISVDRFPGVKNFMGLGQLTAAQLGSLTPTRQPVTPAQLELGRSAWNAFCAPDPTALLELLRRDTSSLPFLGLALVRWLVEFPSTRNGLSKSEESLLRAAYRSGGTHRELYSKSREWETTPFMGDSSAFWRIDHLASRPRPALTRSDDVFTLSEFGRALLNNQADWIRDGGGIDTWLGGTHLAGTDAEWRWNGYSLVKA
jgi:hypothetical protein